MIRLQRGRKPFLGVRPSDGMCSPSLAPLPADVLAAAPAHSDAAVRRVDWILDEIACEDGLEPLEQLAVGTAAHPSLLSPHDVRTSDVSGRWMLNVNRRAEPDL